MSLRQSLRGTGVAIITTFKKNKSIDFEALKKLIDYVIGEGVNYIVTMGTTGETPVLSRDEKRSIIEFTYEVVSGRVPVVVGIGGNDTGSLLEDFEYFPLEGATAILSASPYYNKPSQEGIYQHYKALAEAAPKPILLYNVPGRTGKNMEASTTLRLAEIPNIAGIKEASGDMQQCIEILKYRPETFLVVSGDDALALPQMACGMDGVISVAANCYPGSFSRLVNYCLEGDFKAAISENNDLLEVYQLLFAENNPAGAKAFLYEMGMIENEMRLPLVPLSKDMHSRLKTLLDRQLVK